jgi:hypothetical protein
LNSLFKFCCYKEKTAVLNLRDHSTLLRTFNKFFDQSNVQKSLIGCIFISAAIATGFVSAVRAEESADLKQKLQSLQPTLETTGAIAQASTTDRQSGSLEDGVYLYGQSQEPNEIGSAYLVFESRDGKIIGGFYMPHSSFDCVHGSLEANELAMTVVDSYSQEAHPYAIALEQTSTVAGSAATDDINLEGFHPITEISETDENVLSVCVNNYQEQVWH